MSCAIGQTKGHFDTLDFLNKVCVFLGILHTVSAPGCLAWAFVNEQMRNLYPGDLKGFGEMIQGCITVFI